MAACLTIGATLMAFLLLPFVVHTIVNEDPQTFDRSRQHESDSIVTTMGTMLSARLEITNNELEKDGLIDNVYRVIRATPKQYRQINGAVDNSEKYNAKSAKKRRQIVKHKLGRVNVDRMPRAYDFAGNLHYGRDSNNAGMNIPQPYYYNPQYAVDQEQSKDSNNKNYDTEVNRNVMSGLTGQYYENADEESEDVGSDETESKENDDVGELSPRANYKYDNEENGEDDNGNSEDDNGNREDDNGGSEDDDGGSEDDDGDIEDDDGNSEDDNGGSEDDDGNSEDDNGNSEDDNEGSEDDDGDIEDDEEPTMLAYEEHDDSEDEEDASTRLLTSLRRAAPKTLKECSNKGGECKVKCHKSLQYGNRGCGKGKICCLVAYRVVELY